jgi:hypothetical protein
MNKTVSRNTFFEISIAETEYSMTLYLHEFIFYVFSPVGVETVSLEPYRRTAGKVAFTLPTGVGGCCGIAPHSKTEETK